MNPLRKIYPKETQETSVEKVYVVYFDAPNIKMQKIKATNREKARIEFKKLNPTKKIYAVV